MLKTHSCPPISLPQPSLPLPLSIRASCASVLLSWHWRLGGAGVSRRSRDWRAVVCIPARPPVVIVVCARSTRGAHARCCRHSRSRSSAQGAYIAARRAVVARVRRSRSSACAVLARIAAIVPCFYRLAGRRRQPAHAAASAPDLGSLAGRWSVVSHGSSPAHRASPDASTRP